MVRWGGFWTRRRNQVASVRRRDSCSATAISRAALHVKMPSSAKAEDALGLSDEARKPCGSVASNSANEVI